MELDRTTRESIPSQHLRASAMTYSLDCCEHDANEGQQNDHFEQDLASAGMKLKPLSHLGIRLSDRKSSTTLTQ